MIFSKTFPQIGKSDSARQFGINFCQLFYEQELCLPFSNFGVMTYQHKIPKMKVFP